MIGFVAIGQSDGLVEVVLRVLEILPLAHHRYRLAAVEGFFLSIFLVEFICPGSLEIEGIEQIADSSGFERILIEHFGNHAVRVVVRPTIDDVYCLFLLVKVECLRLCVVECVGFVDEALLQFIALAAVHEDGVGNLGSSRLVECRSLGKQLAAERVDCVGSGITEAQHFVDFLLCLSCSSVVHHAQSVGDAKRGENQ